MVACHAGSADWHRLSAASLNRNSIPITRPATTTGTDVAQSVGTGAPDSQADAQQAQGQIFAGTIKKTGDKYVLRTPAALRTMSIVRIL
jgi:hypothetical protein